MKKILSLVGVVAIFCFLSNADAGSYRERHRATNAGSHSHFHSVGRVSCSGSMLVRAMASCSGKSVRATSCSGVVRSKSCAGSQRVRAVRMKVRASRSCPVGGCP